MSCVEFKKKALSHVIVARNSAPVDYQKLLCHMSVTILGSMSPVEFTKRPSCLSIGFLCRLSIFRKKNCRPVEFKKWLDPL